MRSYIKDHKGLEYKTFGEMCKVYGKTEKLVRLRLEDNQNLKDALTKKSSVKNSNKITELNIEVGKLM